MDAQKSSNVCSSLICPATHQSPGIMCLHRSSIFQEVVNDSPSATFRSSPPLVPRGPGRKRGNRGNRGNRGKYNLHSKRDKKGLIGKDVFYFSELILASEENKN